MNEKIVNNKSIKNNKRHLRAEGFLLLPSALRPRLLAIFNKRILNIAKTIISIIHNICLSIGNLTKDNLVKISSLKHSLMFPLSLVSSIILSSIISGIVLPNLFSSISNVSATSLTLSVPSSISLNLNPSNNKAYGENTNTKISIKTDSTAGYTLSINAKDGNTLKNGNDNTHLIRSITKSDGYENSAAYQASNELNTWAYKPSKLNGNTNTKYLPIPIESTIIEKTTTSPANTTNTYDLTLASMIDNNLPAGSYTNSFVITAIVETTEYSITYDLTGGSWDNDKNPNPQVVNTDGNSVELYPTAPTRAQEGNDSFEFFGWCDQKPIASSGFLYMGQEDTDTCLGTFYDASDFFVFEGDNRSATLYAIWTRIGGCFTAGTLVDTPSGPKPIETIGYGDKVYSYDFEHNQIVEDTVDGYYDVERSDVVKLTFDNGSYIEGTYPHRFYSAARDEWIQMGEFKSGDTLHTVNGLDTTIQSIERLLDKIKVYNLQTAEYHNFFIVVDKNSNDNENSNSSNNNDNGNSTNTSSNGSNNNTNINNNNGYNRYIVKAIIPGNWDADDDYLLKRYPVLPIAGSSEISG